MNWLGLFLLCYAMGAFPSAYIAGRLIRGVDIRELGDGNIGAANAFRELGIKTGVLVGIADIGKGAVVVLLARLITGSETAVLLAGIIAVSGHNWPFFFHFRGGRGAATALGILLALLPQAAIPLALIGLVFLFLFRNTIAFFVVAFAPLAPAAWFTGEPTSHIGYTLALPTLVGISHLLSGQRPIPSRESGVEEKTGQGA